MKLGAAAVKPPPVPVWGLSARDATCTWSAALRTSPELLLEERLRAISLLTAAIGLRPTLLLAAIGGLTGVLFFVGSQLPRLGELTEAAA